MPGTTGQRWSCVVTAVGCQFFGEVLQGVDLIAVRYRPWYRLEMSLAGASTGSAFGSAGYLWRCAGVLWSSGAVFTRNRSIWSSGMWLRALRGVYSVDR